MALEFELNAEPRADLGKGASRCPRLKGFGPGHHLWRGRGAREHFDPT